MVSKIKPRHLDYFDKDVNVGDCVIRVTSGGMYTTKVGALRPSSIGLVRVGYQIWRSRQSKTKKNSYLWLDRWQSRNQIINLSELLKDYYSLNQYIDDFNSKLNLNSIK